MKGDGEVRIQVVGVAVVIGLMMFRRSWRLERSLLNLILTTVASLLGVSAWWLMTFIIYFMISKIY